MAKTETKTAPTAETPEKKPRKVRQPLPEGFKRVVLTPEQTGIVESTCAQLSQKVGFPVSFDQALANVFKVQQEALAPKAPVLVDSAAE